MNEGPPSQLRSRDAVCAQFNLSSSTPPSLKSERKVMGFSPALPFRTGHHLASSASSSSSSSSSEHHPHSLTLNLSSIRALDVSSGSSYPPSVRLPPPLSDSDSSYQIHSKPQYSSRDPAQFMDMQTLETQAAFGLDQVWHSHPGPLPLTAPGLGVGNLPRNQYMSARTREQRIPASQTMDMGFPVTAPLDGPFPSSATSAVSSVMFTNNMGHYTHQEPQTATFDVNQLPTFSPPQDHWSHRADDGTRTMPITGLGIGSGLRGNRAPPPPALNAHVGWQHGSVTGAELSPVSTTFYPYSPFPTAFSQPQLTAPPHATPRSSETFDHSPLALQFPSQVSLQSPIGDRPPRLSSQLSPPTPLSSHLPFSSACYDPSGPRITYASASPSLDPPPTSSPSTLLHALYHRPEGPGSQSSTLDYSDVAAFLGSFTTGQGWPTLPKSAPPTSDQYALSSQPLSDPPSAHPAGLTKKGKPRLPRQLISCDFCRVRKLRCDGQAPCGHCSRRSKDCNYQTSVRKRGKGRKKKESELETQAPASEPDQKPSSKDQGQLFADWSPSSGTRSSE
ncbi:hypothetical protein CROQUDRAFT_668265 [Cronartium quercuum f. sp. fusiforme G11]|uniref:Zn(2)-C6 fungal-type domain-containing protein n=1 Tax=Cronartium quercuum f. sp. fusiforme G11 TaxID=708437 RepID=A0A9P6NPH5_9BASI|nr:hypothetical protein CROQUDRAFT_668265 [Cronartium quercuum f. sp. fusiforme G11]